jgi:hypothetical protein
MSSSLYRSDWMSAVSQNQPLKVEIKGFKTSHFLEPKTAPQDERLAVNPMIIHLPTVTLSKLSFTTNL